MVNKESFRKELDMPMVSGIVIRHIMTDVYGMNSSCVRKLYAGMRNAYVEEAKKDNIAVFKNAVSNKVLFDYLAKLGISKEDMISKIEG